MSGRTTMLKGSILVALIMIKAGPALSSPTVSVSPATTGATIGQEFDVSIVVNAAFTDLSCYALTLAFDESLLELVSASEGLLFSTAIPPTFFSQEVDGQGNDVWTNCLLGFGTSVAGPGELVQLRFRAILDGVADLELMNVVVRDVDRNVIPGVVVENGTANVGITSTPPLRPGGGVRLTAHPNPSSGPVRLSLAAATTSGVAGVDLRRRSGAGAIAILDLAGRHVRTLAGAEEWRWNGRDAAGRRVAAGTYLAVFRHGDVRATTKLIRFQ